MKTFLEMQTITDETLIEKLNAAKCLEDERQQNLKKNSNAKMVRTNELQTEVKVNANVVLQDEADKQNTNKQANVATSRDVKMRNRSAKEKREEAETKDIVQELKTEMEEMRKMLVASMENRYQQPPWQQPGRRRQRGCRACLESGAGDSCSHCYKCGQSGHYAWGCRAPTRMQGNEDGLL